MGPEAFGREEFQAPMAEINTTPLVDVMLVLLVIFLVTAPMLTQSIKLELPNETAIEIKDQKVATISINNEGQYFWDNKPISESELEQNLRDIAAKDAKQPLHIRADTKTSYGKVSHVLALSSRIGLNNIGFITEPK